MLLMLTPICREICRHDRPACEALALGPFRNIARGWPIGFPLFVPCAFARFNPAFTHSLDSDALLFGDGDHGVVEDSAGVEVGL